MSNFEWEIVLTLAIGLAAFAGLSLLEGVFKTRLSPSLRKFIWFFFILKLVLPVGLVSPLIVQPTYTTEAVATDQAFIPAATGTISPNLLQQTNLPGDLQAVKNLWPPAEGLGIDPRWVFLGIYLAGLGIFGSLRLVQRRRLTRILAQAVAADTQLNHLLEAAKRRTHTRSVVILQELEGLGSPILVGLFKPRIILPAGCLATYTLQEISLMLDHELCHWKSRDPWFLAVVNCLHPLFWFQPALWLARTNFVQAVEEACDARVLGLRGDANRQFYGLTLLKVLCQPQGGLRLSPAMASPQKLVKSRIRLLSLKPKLSPWAAGLLTAVFLGSCVWGAKVPEATPVSEPPQQVPEASKKLLNQVMLSWPLAEGKGKITFLHGPALQEFTGAKYFHNGIDIDAEQGEPVLAAQDGIVVEGGFDAEGPGNYVIISQSYGFSTRYSQLASVADLFRGDKVLKGQVIGTVGSTGASTHPHLGFELFLGTQAVDPLNYLIRAQSHLAEPMGKNPKDTQTFNGLILSPLHPQSPDFEPWIWPLEKKFEKITQSYGSNKHPFTGQTYFHEGIDIAAPSGTSVLAAQEGTVSKIDYDPNGYGYYIEIHYKPGYKALYAQLKDRPRLTERENVKKGQVVGYVGSSGYSTGPHLHFQLNWDFDSKGIFGPETIVNPLDYLEKPKLAEIMETLLIENRNP